MRRRRIDFIIFIIVVSLIAYGCTSSNTVKGVVVGILDNELTIRKENDRLVTLSVDNAEEIRVLDTVVVKDKKASVKRRVMEDN